MTFKHKLSARLARLWVTLAVVGVACERLAAPTGPAPVVQIVILPESLTVAPAQQIQFAAYGRTSAGERGQERTVSRLGAGECPAAAPAAPATGGESERAGGVPAVRGERLHGTDARSYGAHRPVGLVARRDPRQRQHLRSRRGGAEEPAARVPGQVPGRLDGRLLADQVGRVGWGGQQPRLRHRDGAEVSVAGA